MDTHGLARQEVAQWYHAVEWSGLDELLRRVRRGEEFMLVYESIEKRQPR